MLAFIFPLARLVEERSPREGLVQVYHNKTWIWVCANQWDKHDADVASEWCTLMGLCLRFLTNSDQQNLLYGSIKCSVQETKVLSSHVNMVLWELMAARIKLVLYVDQKVNKSRKWLSHHDKKKTLWNISYFLSAIKVQLTLGCLSVITLFRSHSAGLNLLWKNKNHHNFIFFHIMFLLQKVNTIYALLCLNVLCLKNLPSG